MGDYRFDRDLNHQMRLWAKLTLQSLGVIAATVGIALVIGIFIPTSGVSKVIFYILSGLFGIFLSFANRTTGVGQPNYKVYLNLFKKDKNTYEKTQFSDEVENLEFSDKAREENWRKESDILTAYYESLN